jgi:hypothetical protein
MTGRRWSWDRRCEARAGSPDELHLAEQWAGMPDGGLIISTRQRTTKSGHSVLLKPGTVRELRDALDEWLARTEASP